MDFFEKTIKTDVKFEGRILKMRVDTVELSDGSTSTREIIEHPGGVAVLGYICTCVRSQSSFRDTMCGILLILVL